MALTYDLILTVENWNAANPVTLLEEINDYYEKRGLKTPDAIEALMWMISEVGELVEAYIIETGDAKYRLTLNNFIAVCRDIEKRVAKRPGWVRNNQPKGTYDLPGEAGDVRMMLEVFCQQARLPESGVCLRAKMERKLRETNK